MDLDFSFALVSSLTPRRKAEKSSTTEVLKKTNLLKTKLNLPLKSQNLEDISHKKRDEKENLIPKEQLMNKNELLRPVENKGNSNPSNSNHRRQSNEKSGFFINMENIAVRKNRAQRRKKIETSPLQPCDNVLEINDESAVGPLQPCDNVLEINDENAVGPLQPCDNVLEINDENAVGPLQPCDNVLEISDENAVGKPDSPDERVLLCAEIVDISSDIGENCHNSQSNKNESKNVQGKLPCLSRISNSSVRSSLEVVESSCSEVKGDSFDNCRSLRSLSAKKRNVKTRPSRTSETSLSTAYDSDSFQAIRRQGKKVIPETPDTDKSSGEGFNEKRKSSILSFTSEDNKETQSLRSNVNESPKKNTKRKSSQISRSPDENKKRSSIESLRSYLRPKRKSSLLHLTSKNNKPVALDELEDCVADSANEVDKLESMNSACNNTELGDPAKVVSKYKTESRLKKKLRSNNDSSVSDMFKLESTIKDHSLHSDMKNEYSKNKFGSALCSNNEIQKKNISTESKGKNPKVIDFKKPDLVKNNRNKEKELTSQKHVSKQKTDDSSKINLQVTKNKHCSPTSPKMSTLVLPSEIITKFENINRWLKDTQEKTTGSLEIDSAATDVISKKDMVPIKNKNKVSLSPRIKKKKEKAKTSLEEEQKLFEELYGADYEKRLSDDVDEITSRTSCQDSVEFSENVLDKLYGTVWQKNTAVTQSEPREGRKKKNTKKKTPLTERKKHRTSIYEVFSSSSSEDRFEEFLETVQRGKVELIKRRVGRPGTPEFINDSDSEDNASIEFYQNIVSSAVKDEFNNLKRDVIQAGQETHKVNRRRLSFGSSKDDGCSESGRSDARPTNKGKKSSNEDKAKTKKSRPKKKTNKYIEGKGDDDIDVFSLVTPLKIRGKKTETDFSEKFKNPVVPEVPRSVGKSKTPKNPTRQKDLNNSEERLKTNYLRECDFKVPKSASKTFKTPSKSSKTEIPSSPALSFLSSLSEMTAGLPCHPDALVYKKNFKTKREELTKRLFSLYNKEVFDNQLPADMLVQWSTRMTSTSGYCYNKRIYRDNQVLRSSRIVLSTKILDRGDRLRDTLIHELCHAATWIVDATSDGHGPLWRAWADKAHRRFPELPVIKRCHDYAISTKFTYKCTSCGYSIGRHTKSLDTERKRCGYCFGKFQVFVTAKMASASATSGSDSVKTPRNPTGFALFVKENYAIIKKENNVPHGQVMKLLSQKFAEVKISKQNTEEVISIE